ncbi:MAG: competence/damage-inducible protein A [Verrucomicrobiota bacterium]|nr:competence/damage-inducible protein A [Verrucomicrobiota bacterium]
MRIELITTGSELLLGRVLNTHQQWLGRELDAHGWTVERQVSVSDTGPAIEAAVREGLNRADLIITTGGLGPTADDITRDRIAALLGRSLKEDSETRDRIAAFFRRIQRPMPESVLVQAQIPEGALILPNRHGTAPGLFLELVPNPFADGPAWLLMLPGPPRELRPMVTHQAIPLLLDHCPPSERLSTRVLKVAGMGESMVEGKISSPLEALAVDGLDLGYCSRNGEVDIRLRAPDVALVERAEAAVREALGPHIFGTDDDTLEQHLIQRLTERCETLAVAESCTGGFLAHRLTNVPGASAVFLAGLVTYSNEAKQTILGVKAATLAAHGAVSEETAREMAEGARVLYGTDYALATTGIAGPSGGTAEKPVGTVHIALATPESTYVFSTCNAVDRETFKFVTTQQAMDFLRRRLVGVGA